MSNLSLASLFNCSNSSIYFKRGTEHSAGLDILNSDQSIFNNINIDELKKNNLTLEVVSRSSMFIKGYYTHSTIHENKMDINVYNHNTNLSIDYLDVFKINPQPCQLLCYKSKPIYTYPNSLFPNIVLDKNYVKTELDFKINDSFPRNCFIKIYNLTNKCLISGIIDSDYRDNVSIIIRKNNTYNENTIIEYGIDYIVELYEYIKFKDESDVKVSHRFGGFGSTDFNNSI